jgi:2-polyprenyl-3-methyl-5-hydroxy-6-metoxy-1,4-benzoquinol methylase
VYAGPDRVTAEESRTRYSDDFFEAEYLPSLGVRDGRFDLAAFDERYRHLLERLAPFRDRGTLLEVGSGAGFFVRTAERAGWKATGLEVMPAGVRFAREALGVDVRLGTLDGTDLPAGGFDAVVLLDVIEHLHDPRAVLARARSLLRPGGALLLFTPNYDALSRRALGTPWAVLSPVEHLYYFTEASLGRVLREAGFRGATFDRRVGWRVAYDTVNPLATHEPDGLRARAFRWLVDRSGDRALALVQRLGLGDALLCVAQA